MDFEGVEPRSPDFSRSYCFSLKGQAEWKATVHRALGQKEQKVCEGETIVAFSQPGNLTRNDFSKEAI